MRHSGPMWELYKEMVRSLREDGLSTQGMYTAYLMGENRRLQRELNELRADHGIR